MTPRRPRRRAWGGIETSCGPLLWPGCLRLRGAGESTTAHVRLVAGSVGVSVRQVWRWLVQAEETGSTEKPERRRFRITDEIIDVLADYQGNVKRAHEHLTRLALAAGEKPVGLTTLHDAVARDLDPGFMAGLREGIPAARGFDPAFQRPAVARNQVWEGDHKQAPTVVMMPIPAGWARPGQAPAHSNASSEDA